MMHLPVCLHWTRHFAGMEFQINLYMEYNIAANVYLHLGNQNLISSKARM